MRSRSVSWSETAAVLDLRALPLSGLGSVQPNGDDFRNSGDFFDRRRSDGPVTADSSGLAGDGGPATSGLLNSPFGVAALDGKGDLLISDRLNHAVRIVGN